MLHCIGFRFSLVNSAINLNQDVVVEDSHNFVVDYDRAITELSVLFNLLPVLSSDLVIEQHITVLDISIEGMV